MRRAVFLSDVHLGSHHCHAEELAEFLSTLRCKRLYLVGDIVDLWWLAQRRATWGAAHNRVVEALHALRRAGTEIVYIPGNHDRPVRRFCGLVLPAMRIRRRAIHVRRGSRDVRFAPQAIAELEVGSTDMPGERVAAARFVRREVAPRAARVGRRRAAAVERGHQDQGADHRAHYTSGP